MRDRQRLAAARSAARERAKLVVHGVIAMPTKRKPQRLKATAEQLAFRDYINQGMTAEEARARIIEDKRE